MALVHCHRALNRPGSPDCSVCIANYNGVHLLAECIGSVLAQHGAAFEILVHDDASTDGSVEWIRQRFPQVEILASSENVGFCVANNRMVAHARGRHVLLLNNDAGLHPGALETLLDESRSGDAVLTLPQYDWSTGELVDRGCLLDPFYNPVPNTDCKRTDVAMAIGACLFLPRELWTTLGGFPEWFGSIGEDLYLCCLARLRGIPVRVARRSGYRHRQGASFGGNRAGAEGLATTFRRRALSERNKTTALFVCTPTFLMWVLLGMHVLALALEGIVLAALRRDGRVWSSIYAPVFAHLARGFGRLRRLRRSVQAGRRSSLQNYLRAFVLVPWKLHLLRRHGVPVIR